MYGLDSAAALSGTGLGQRAGCSRCFSPFQSDFPPQVIIAPSNTILAFCLFLSLWAITKDQLVCLV